MAYDFMHVIKKKLKQANIDPKMQQMTAMAYKNSQSFFGSAVIFSTQIYERILENFGHLVGLRRRKQIPLKFIRKRKDKYAEHSGAPNLMSEFTDQPY